MSHIHLPDGILPVWLWVLGYIIIGIYLVIVSFYLKKPEAQKKMALVGVMAAIMLITMSVEIIPPAYHMNLAALSGIILGPILSILSVVVANFMLAFFGHGGITTIGLNAIVVSIEAVSGFFLFVFIQPKIRNIFASTFIATILALIISAMVSISIVYLGTGNIAELLHNHDQITATHNSTIQQAEAPTAQRFNIAKFSITLLSLGLLGWIIEGLISAFIVNYITKIRPDIIEESTGLTLK